MFFYVYLEKSFHLANKKATHPRWVESPNYVLLRGYLNSVFFIYMILHQVLRTDALVIVNTVDGVGKELRHTQQFHLGALGGVEGD